MDKEEIIIDGVNVAGCEHHLSTGYCQLQMIFQGMVLKLPFGKHLECNLCDKDCYYKQLQRAKEENEEQRKIIQCKTGTILSLAKIRDELKAENEKLKQQLKQQQYKRELNYGQGYKAYATEKGVIVEC